MKNFLISLFLSFACLSSGGYNEAKEPYAAEIVLNAESARVYATNLNDLSQELQQTAIEFLIPNYTPTSAVAIGINLRGINAFASFAANSTDLVFIIPTTGVTEVFSGSTRDESVKLFKNFIQNAGNNHNLLKAYARYSPIDPIAGNPNSLMAQMGQSDYLLGRLAPLSGCCCCWNITPLIHQFRVGTTYGRGWSKGFDTTAISLPLRYTYSPNDDLALILDAPFTLNNNGGAYSFLGSIGVGIRLPVNYAWSLTPVMRLGSGGSVDLVSGGCFFSTGLTSSFDVGICDSILSMTNYVGYITSTNLWLGGINFNYGLHNYVFKNGLSLTSCNSFTICEQPLHMSVSIVDTCFSRGNLYINHYDEIGVALVTTHLNPCLDYDALSIGCSYQFGRQSFRGYTANLVYDF